MDITTGVALIEVYDLDPAADSRLGNISTRAFVQARATTLSSQVSFWAAGALTTGLSCAALVRAWLTLACPTSLANPTLELRDGNGALLIANNDWQDDPIQASEITAAGLAPANNLESGIAATFPPGLYTALLAGWNNGYG